MCEVYILCEFAAMQAGLSAPKSVIHHCEVPTNLIAKDPIGLMTPIVTKEDDDPPTKKPHTTSPNIWNPGYQRKFGRAFEGHDISFIYKNSELL